MKTFIKKIILLLYFLPALAFGYSFSPLNITLKPFGLDSSITCLLNNNSAVDPVAVEIYVLERIMGLDGKTIIGDDVTDKFNILPAQNILMPNEERYIQIIWRGSPKVDSQQYYFLKVKELDIPKDLSQQDEDQEKATFHFNILNDYLGHIYITPDNIKPNLIVNSAEIQANEAGQCYLSAICENTGTGIGSTTKYKTLTIQSEPSDNVKSIKPIIIAISEHPEVQLKVFAKAKRAFLIPLSGDYPLGPVEILLK